MERLLDPSLRGRPLAICAAGPTGATPGLEGGPGLVLNVDDPDIGRWFEPVPGSAAAVPRGVYA